jgi:alkanesulfonate monooxygenase SsuD/methylene tetrahydromethanopterin reductase-like flavin-dependent oxidoreductase (luciferase family)
MRYSFQVSLEKRPWIDILEFFRLGDGLSIFETGYVADHFNPTAYSAAGHPMDGAGRNLEGWCATAALLQATSRLRVGPLVTCVAFRNVGLLAKMITTLDVISDGRVEVALGGGWNEAEAAAYGIGLGAPRVRLARLEESVVALNQLLTQDEVDFEGAFWELRGVRVEPRSVQRPRPPFTIGGRGVRRTLPIVVAHAEHWNIPPIPAEEVRGKALALQARCDTVGRDRKELTLSTQIRIMSDTVESDVQRQAEALQEAGTDLLVMLFSDPDVRPQTLEMVAGALERL